MTYEEAQRYENKVVRVYINKYGHENVRGGDISMTGSLIKRFGYYWDKEEWYVLTTVIVLVLMMILMAILYYLQ